MRKTNLWTLFFVNLLAGLFGFLYYAQQFSQTPWQLWLFVPDCPLYALVFAAALLLVIRGKQNPTFFVVAATGAFKYGAWTLIVIPLFKSHFLSPQNIYYYSFLWLAHLGMVLESFLLVAYAKPRMLNAAVAAAWFLVNDFFDYFGGTLPWLPSAQHDTFLLAYAVAASVLFPLFCLKAPSLLPCSAAPRVRGKKPPRG